MGVADSIPHALVRRIGEHDRDRLRVAAAPMLGFHVSVHRLTLALADVRASMEGQGPESMLNSIEVGERVAVWQVDTEGIAWINRLVENDLAVGNIGTGYPGVFFAPAKHLLPTILDGPPHAKKTWVFGVSDTIGPEWEGRTVIDRDVARDCDPDEWLIVKVWDES
jgi:hypothetical protein